MARSLAHEPDRPFLFISASLIVAGLFILASASVAIAQRDFGNPLYFVVRQLTLGVAAGLAGAVVVQYVPLAWLRMSAPFLFFATVALLFLVLVPGIGLEEGGATRWLGFHSITIQPSEIAKLTLPLYLSTWFANRSTPRAVRGTRHRSRVHAEEQEGGFMHDANLVPFLMIVGIIGAPIILQPDLSTFGVLSLTALLLYFLSGAPLCSVAALIVGGSGALLVLIRVAPYRMNRILAFLNPQSDPLGIGYHVQQALLAVGSGGLFGRGLGFSREKLFFLPEPVGDSIFAVFAEEAGFVGATALILLFAAFLWRGFFIARRISDPFARLLAAGLVGSIVVQAFLNIGGNLAVAPIVGITLPFISYGSASLTMTLISTGIVYKLSRYTRE